MYGLWSGLSINNTAEVAATGYLWGTAAGTVAVAAKLCRILLLGLATLLLIPGTNRSPSALLQGWTLTPKFALGFLVLSGLTSGGWLTAGEVRSLGHASSLLFLLAFVGLGLRLRWRDIRCVGLRPLLTAGAATVAASVAGLAASQAACSLAVAC